MKKMKFAKICIFAVKNGGSQAGVNPFDPFGVSRVTLLSTSPIFNLENANLLLISFSSLFSLTVARKTSNKEPFINVETFETVNLSVFCKTEKNCEE